MTLNERTFVIQGLVLCVCGMGAREEIETETETQTEMKERERDQFIMRNWLKRLQSLRSPMICH